MLVSERFVTVAASFFLFWGRVQTLHALNYHIVFYCRL